MSSWRSPILRVWKGDLKSSVAYEFEEVKFGKSGKNKLAKGGDIGLFDLVEPLNSGIEQLKPGLAKGGDIGLDLFDLVEPVAEAPPVEPVEVGRPEIEPEATKPPKPSEHEKIKPSEKPSELEKIKPSDKPHKPQLSRVTVFPEDRVSDFKEKIQLVTGIPPFRQHIFYHDADKQAHPLYYQIRTERPLVVDLAQDLNLPRVAGVPVRTEVYQERDSLFVQARDHFYTMGQLAEEGVHEFNLVDLQEYTGSLASIASDSHQLGLVYYGFIAIYYPMLNWEAFQVYISDGSLAQAYPELQPNPATLDKRYKAEATLLQAEHKAHIHANILSAPSIKSSILQSKFNQAIVNIQNLHSRLVTSEDVPLIRTRIYHEYKPLIITKLHKEAGETAFEHLKFRLQMPDVSSIILGIRLRRSTAKTSQRHNYAILVIRAYGPLQLRTAWAEDDHMTFKELAELTLTVNKQIAAINALGREILTSSYQLPELAPYNTKYSSLTLHIFWQQSLNAEQFQVMKQAFQDDFPSGVVAPVNSEETVPAGTFMFRYLKGMVYDELATPADYNYGPDLDNYEYLVNAKSRVRWLAAYGQGRTCAIVTRTADTRIEIQDVREAEFEQIRAYVAFKMGSLSFGKSSRESKSSTQQPTNSKPESINTKNLLKLLKVRDPELFNFRQHSSEVVFSRICQREHQPVPLNESEYKNFIKDPKNKKLRPIKYHNFTTQTPMYYVCPNARFPHLSFITGQHPKDFCLPCCKKTLLEGAQNTKKGVQHNVCLESGRYTDSASESGANSRYIMNYGKSIEINRLGHLPELLLRYFLYNSQILTGVDIHDISKSAYYLYGIPQHSGPVSDIGVVFAAANALETTPEALLKDLRGYLKDHPEQYSSLLQGRLPDYFADVEDFKNSLISIDASQNRTATARATRFTSWNEVVLELLRAAKGIETIILEDTALDTSGTSHKSESNRDGIDFILPRQVQHSKEIFTRADVKKFLVLLRKTKRVRNLFSSNYIYFPIYQVTPQAFFRNSSIDVRLFALGDDMTKLLEQMTQEVLDLQRLKMDMTLDEIDEMVKPMGLSISELYTNHKGQVHTVCLEVGAKRIAKKGGGVKDSEEVKDDSKDEPKDETNPTVEDDRKEESNRAIVEHVVENTTERILENGSEDLKDETLVLGAGSINAKTRIYMPIPHQYACGVYAESPYLESTYPGTPDRKKACSLKELIDFITSWNHKHPDRVWNVHRWLIHTEKCIGLESRGTYFYCRSESLAVLDKISRSLLDSSKRKYLTHTPEEINAQLEQYDASRALPDPSGLREKTRLQVQQYNKFLRSVMSRMDSDRDKTTRKQVAKILQTIKKPRRIDEALREAGLTSTDIEKIRTNNYKPLRDDEIYGFDLIRLKKIREIGDVPVTSYAEEEAKRAKLRKYIKNELRLKDSVELELLVADFCNPLRREYLLQAIILEDMGLAPDLEYGPEEEVFILR